MSFIIPELEFADVLITRNAKEEDNGSPGYWNHLAIYTPLGVIEAQMPPWNSIICTPLNEFFDRYPKLKVFRLKNIDGYQFTNEKDKVAKSAVGMIGKPYKWLASLFPRLKRNRGDNCVTLLRKVYLDGINIDLGWKIPDDLVGDAKFEEVYSKN